jgi:hypothetical protein
MIESLPFLFLVLVLAALGAAAVRVVLPNAQAFRQDKDKLEALAWSFSSGAVVLWCTITLIGTPS